MTNVAARGTQIWETPEAMLFSRTHCNSEFERMSWQVFFNYCLLKKANETRILQFVTCNSFVLQTTVVSYSAMTLSTEGFDNLNRSTAFEVYKDWLITSLPLSVNLLQICFMERRDVWSVCWTSVSLTQFLIIRQATAFASESDFFIEGYDTK